MGMLFHDWSCLDAAHAGLETPASAATKLSLFSANETGFLRGLVNPDLAETRER
jgi:hypothetical protein